MVLDQPSFWGIADSSNACPPVCAIANVGYWAQLVLPDDVTAHPLQVSIDIASLAPNAEITVFPWKDPPELKARTSTARTFLKRHLPS